MYEFLYELFGNQILAMLLTACIPLVFLLLYALVAVWLERKIAAHIQDRLGPMRVGWHGSLQLFADFLKTMQKELTHAKVVDKILYEIAPILCFTGSLAAFAVIPFSSKLIGSEIELGLFFLIAVSSFMVVGVLMAGWSSNNKYSLLGSMRSAAQIISYEIPTAIIVLSMIMITGTLSLSKITEMQTSSFWNWYILGGPGVGVAKFLLIPCMFVSCLILYISSLAEVNRTPFDIPEADSELVAGYSTEYPGVKYVWFMLTEYMNMYAVSALVAILFLGGYQSPCGYLGNSIGMQWMIPFEQAFWFIAKGVTLVCVQIWIRWTLPRLRVDQLMNLCWKYLIPFAILNLIIIGLISLL